MEKTQENLPYSSRALIVPEKPTRRPLLVKHIALLALVALTYCTVHAWKHDLIPSCSHQVSEPLCPQAAELVPKKNEKLWDSLSERFTTDDFEARAIDWLAGAVRIP